MRVLKFTLIAVCFLFIASSVSDASAQSSDWREKDAVEAMGWNVAYAKGVTTEDAVRGMVEAGIYLNRKDVLAWADSLLRQAVGLMIERKGSKAAQDFNRLEQQDARRFFLQTMRDLLRNRASGSEILDTGSVEVKAGIMEHGERKNVLVPYVGIRSKYAPSRNGDNPVDDLANDYRASATKKKSPSDAMTCSPDN
jgi:hypothetical protein